MSDISSLAAAAVGSQSALTAGSIAIAVLKQQAALEQQLAAIIADAAQAAILPAGQGAQLDLSI
jgi:hypothetical protein